MTIIERILAILAGSPKLTLNENGEHHTKRRKSELSRKRRIKKRYPAANKPWRGFPSHD